MNNKTIVFYNGEEIILYPLESQIIEINDFIQALLATTYATERNTIIKAQQIIVEQNISFTLSHSLSLVAQQDIIFKKNAFINLNGNGALYLKAGIENSEGKGTVIFEDINHKQIVANNNIKVHIYYNPMFFLTLDNSEPNVNNEYSHKYHNPNGYFQHVTPQNAVVSYMLINSVEDLQDINKFLHGNYALSKHIDASETINWNNQKGFAPLTTQLDGEMIPFTGNFDGNNFQISNLYIDREEDNVGLFGIIAGSKSGHVSISNLNLVNITINGTSYVGGVTGEAEYVDFENIKIIDSNIRGKSIVGGFAGTASGVELHDIELNQVLDSTVTASDYSGIYFGAIRDSTIHDSQNYCAQVEATEQLHCNGFEVKLVWQE